MSCRLLGLAIAVLFTAVACGGAEPEGAISLPPPDGGATVSEALASGTGVMWVRGYVVAERGRTVRLCETITESFPPACGGASLDLRDGVLWREPYSDSHPFGEVTPGGGITDGVLTTDEPCGYEPDGPCAALLGLATNGDVVWTDVPYSVFGTVDGGELHRPRASDGADL